MINVTFVCLGNICRSPAAEAIFRTMVKHSSMSGSIYVESCGTGDWHVGQEPDARMVAACKLRGYELTSKAQVFEPYMLDEFDYILAADRSVLEFLQAEAFIPAHKNKLMLLSHYSSEYLDKSIPDPYYSGDDGFMTVIDMLEESLAKFLDHLVYTASISRDS